MQVEQAEIQYKNGGKMRAKYYFLIYWISDIEIPRKRKAKTRLEQMESWEDGGKI